MNHDPRANANLTLDALRQIEDICTGFEQCWRSGKRPRIEDLLVGAIADERSALLRELLAVELEYRMIAGEKPPRREYLARFPDDPSIVMLALQEAEVAAFANRATDDSEAHTRGDLPRIFSDYRLLEEIARGGMGVVYKAQQISLDRTVAVKMILAGPMASALEVERFYVEVQTAAQLDHPNIVPIFEVGQWEGQRYFSMAFVDGDSLANRLSVGSLPPREATELLLPVADAIHYAHSRGIIHRDLKPANILIDSHGRPHITDFGLAKRVANKRELTATGEVIGTPGFLPPEQAIGDTGSIGVASDVYSLGAVLYAALTGRAPFQAANTLDTLRQVTEQDPVPPRRLDGTVPRDLETIALRCLEKQPAKRYESAQEVADEMRRFLVGAPIRARSIGSVERLRRWCRRNPVVAGMAGLTAILLLAITATSTMAVIRIGALRDVAVEHEQRSTISLQRAEAERLRAEENLHYAQRTIRELAGSYSLLGDQQKTVDESLQWYGKAHSILTTLAADSPSKLESQMDLAESFGRLGMSHARAGQSKRAVQAFDQAVDILDRLCQQHPDRPEYRAHLAQLCDFLGHQYRLDNRYDAAIAKHDQARLEQEQFLDSRPPDPIQARRALAAYYSHLGHTYYDMDDFADSEESFDRARSQLEQLLVEQPDNVDIRADLAIVCRDIGMRKTPGERAPWLHRAHQLLGSVIESGSRAMSHRFEYAKLLTALAKDEKQLNRALLLQQQAHDGWEKLAAEFPSDPEIQRNMVWSLRDDASLLILAGHYPAAADALQRAVDNIRAVAPAGSPERYSDFEVSVLAMLAQVALHLEDLDLYRGKCRALLDHCLVKNCYQNDALRVCLVRGDAVDTHDQVVAVAKDAISQGSKSLRKLANVGAALYRAGRFAEAIEVLGAVEKSNQLALFARAGTAEVVRADNARVAVFLAMAHNRLGHVEDARRCFEKATEWLDNEGSRFAAPSLADADQAKVAKLPDTTAEAEAQLTLEDRILLADIALEMQFFVREAKLLVAATAK
jgi:tetratricopeptide (TPR) repeat protein